jgi:acyl carrier protein
MTNIEQTVKEFILAEFLPGEDPSQLTAATPLVTSGILDSIATMKLATFLEDHFKIELAAHDLSVDYLNTLADIAKLVESRRVGA